MVRRHVARRAREVAFASLPANRRSTTNLYIDTRVLHAGETLGPKFAPVRLKRDSVLVFADHQPNANYSHDCQYLLFDTESGKPLQRIRAKFPPYEIERRKSMRLFHEPVPTKPVPLVLTSGTAPCPALPPIGRRFAILFAGAAQRHHVNDLELCYRMLTGPYQFAAEDVFVLCHSGNPADPKGPFVDDDFKPRKFTDGSAFTITQRPMLQGTATALESVITTLRNTPIADDDLLFIHTNGHGGFEVFPESDHREKKGAYLCTWARDNPVGGQYFANTLSKRLKKLPKFRMLLMLAQQCFGGGFKDPVLNGSKADETSIACAAEASGISYFSKDMNFTHFTLDWLSAQRRQRADDGTNVNVDGNLSGAIEASEAYGYAFTNRDTRDSPNFASEPAGAELAMALSDPNPLSPNWCAFIQPLVRKYQKTRSGPQYDRIIRSVLPQLIDLVLPVLKKQAGDIRLELTARIERILADAFGESPPGPRSHHKKDADPTAKTPGAKTTSRAAAPASDALRARNRREGPTRHRKV